LADQGISGAERLRFSGCSARKRSSILLLALFFVRFCALTGEPVSDSSLRRFGLLAGFAFVNRIDSTLLFAAPLAWLAIQGLRGRDHRVRPLVIAFGVPVAAWLLFATFYYGFPPEVGRNGPRVSARARG
jgi:hypothetical protein